MHCKKNRLFAIAYRKIYRRYPIMLFAIYLLCGTVSAQPFTLDENIKPVELKLVKYHPDNEIGQGMICVTDVTQTRDTLYFFIKGFSIYSPSYAGITATKGSDKIDIGLYKENWRKPDAAGITDSKGHWEKGFKTEGDYGIMVVPSSLPASYSLVIWTGKEADAALPTVFKTTGSAGNGDNKSLFEKYSLQIILGLAVLIVVLVIFLLKKRKK